MHRRTFFTLTAAAAVASTMRPLAATAGEAMSRDLRGMDGQLIRLPSLDVESNQEFLSEVRTWVQRAPDGLMNVARKRAKEILQENGFSPDAELPAEQVIALMENDTTMMASARAWLSTQALSWRGVKQLFDAEQDFYLTALHDAEKKGTGTLELNRSMVVPNYARHEIHAMPGGYVGDPLAGYVYHYGTNAFYMGDNDQDEIQVKIANAAPIPSNGKVRRILDIGCGVGQTTVALKRRFPDAEVWGIDVGGPMVHYAHMRATDLGVNVNFRQGLAEATGFPGRAFRHGRVLHPSPRGAQRRQIRRSCRKSRVYCVRVATITRSISSRRAPPRSPPIDSSTTGGTIAGTTKSGPSSTWAMTLSATWSASAWPSTRTAPAPR
jgi:SAM-dependent methyltransferase